MDYQAEYDRLQQAWDEALDRVYDTNEHTKVVAFTQDHRAVTDVAIYLEDNRANLTVEETFFLQVTVELRKVAQKIREHKS